MVKKITLTRQVPAAARPAVLGSAELALATGGSAEVGTEVLKTRHDTAKNAIGNIR
jgi:hypothetical protein